MKVSELALKLGLRFEGDGDREITGAAPVDVASSEDLTFAGPKALAAARVTKAGCVIVPALFENTGQTILRADNPRLAFAGAVRLLFPPPLLVPGVHPTAVIDATAQVHTSAEVGPHVSIGARAIVGENSRIGAGSRVGSDSSIGAGSTLHANVVVYSGVRVGLNVILHSGAVLGADGFGFVLTGERYEKFPQIGRVEIEDNVEIGANSCVDRAALGVTRIGEGTKLDNMVHIGHNCNIGKHVVIAAQTGLSGGVVIEDYAVIGGQVGIGDKARIESGAVLGSGSGVLTSKVVHAGTPQWGTPARPLKEHLESLAHLRRLPALRAEFEDLKRRLAALESRR